MRLIHFNVSVLVALLAVACPSGEPSTTNDNADGRCESSAQCDADSDTFGQICISGACTSCAGDAECQRVEYYGANFSCVNGACRATGSGGDDCSTKVCADRQLCDVLAGVATCLEECESGFDWDASSGSCVEATTGCESITCADRQLCEVQSGTPTCLPECEAGFDWNATTMACDANASANCQSGDPDSILDTCTAENRECVESASGASCGDCLSGNIEVSGACRAPLTCADVSCDASTELCVQDPGVDARCVTFDPATCDVGADLCPENFALNPTTRSCVSCGPCDDGPGHTGELYPITTQTGDCLCVPEDGFFISKSAPGEAIACDADDDGWTRVSAKNSLEDGDCAIRANARCEVRTVDRLVLYSDEDGAQEELLVSEYSFSSLFTDDNFLSLYENDVNDDLSLRSPGGEFPPLDAFNSGPGTFPGTAPFDASDLNSLTKACAADSSGTSGDYNANGVADVEEWHGMTPPGGADIDGVVQDFIHLSYFVELMEGWYEPPTAAPFEHGSYHIREKSRATPQMSSNLLAIEPVYDDSNDQFADQCYRKEDTRITDLPQATEPNIGMDYSRPFFGERQTTAPNGFFLGHSSQFKCVEIFAATDTRTAAAKRQAPHQVAVEAFTSADPEFEFTACRRPSGIGADIDGDPSLDNPTDPPIVCQAGAVQVGLVAFATVIYDPAAPSGCLDECGEQELLPPSDQCETFGEPDASCTSDPVTGELTECGFDAGCAFCVENESGGFDCTPNDNDCGAGAAACGECAVDTSGALPVATCQARASDCAGNCSVCNDTGTPNAFTCKPNASTCTGNCDVCSGSGNSYSCIANNNLCAGGCATCAGSGTSFSCQAAANSCLPIDDINNACGSISWSECEDTRGGVVQQNQIRTCVVSTGLCENIAVQDEVVTCTRADTNGDPCSSVPACEFESSCEDEDPNTCVDSQGRRGVRDQRCWSRIECNASQQCVRIGSGSVSEVGCNPPTNRCDLPSCSGIPTCNGNTCVCEPF